MFEMVGGPCSMEELKAMEGVMREMAGDKPSIKLIQVLQKMI